MSARSLARAAAALFAVAVLAGLVYAAQRQAAPVEVQPVVPPEQLLPSTKAAVPPRELGVIEPGMLMPTTKSGDVPAELLLPSTKAAPVRLPQP